LGGLASLSVFCILYALSAEKTSWPLSSALALAGFIAAASIWRFASLPLWPIFALIVAVISVVAILMPRREARAGTLGPQLSWHISPFPVFGLVLAAFAHKGEGSSAAARLLRGALAPSGLPRFYSSWGCS